MEEAGQDGLRLLLDSGDDMFLAVEGVYSLDERFPDDFPVEGFRHFGSAGDTIALVAHSTDGRFLDDCPVAYFRHFGVADGTLPVVAAGATVSHSTEPAKPTRSLGKMLFGIPQTRRTK